MNQLSVLALTFVVVISTFSGLQHWAIDATDPETEMVNVAFGRPAWQSSVNLGRGASLANDGNNDSNSETAGSCSVMIHSTQAWWAVDLGVVVEVQKVTITQSNEVENGLGDFTIGATETSPLVKAPSALASSEYDLCSTRIGNISLSTTETFTCPSNSVSGRYVFVLMTILPPFGFQMCEVEVFASEHKINAALRRPTFQSSIEEGRGPSLAVDGNRNPSLDNVGSCSSTKKTPKPWWAVDLGKVFTIKEIYISQSDKNEGSLTDFILAATDVSPTTTSPADLAASAYELCCSHPGPLPLSTTKTFGCRNNHISGRYVFILSQGSNGLQLCEVEVIVSPSAVQNLEVFPRDESSLTVKWDPTVDGVLTGYRVTLGIESDATQSQTKETDKYTSTVEFTGLTAGTGYTIGVETVKEYENSTIVEHKFYTIPNAPQKLELQSTSVDSLTVKWELPALSALTEYNVTLTYGGTHQTQTTDNNKTTQEFTDLTAGTEYTVSVVAVSGDQRSVKVEDKFYTKPNAPGNLTVLYRTGRSLTVNWDAPAVGTLTGYSVTLSGNGTIKTQTIGNDTTTSAFTGLTAGTEYTVGVVTVSGDQQSADEVNNTFYTIPDAVRNLVVSDRSNSSLTVGWDVRADGVLSGYGVTVKGDGTPQTQNPDRDTTTHEFTGLTAGTEYIVSVLTVSGDQQSAKVEDKFYTKPNAPGNLTVLSRTGRSLTLNWDAPAVGTLTGYSVTLSGNGTIKTQTHGNDTTTSAFTGLTAGTEYTVGVVTVSGDQQSADEVKGKFYIIPDAVRNLVVSARSNSSLTVGWDVPADGGLSGYSVTIKGDGATQTQNSDKDTTTHEFTSLTAGTEYTVSVFTVSGNQQSAKVEDTFYTKPNAQRSLQVMSRTGQSLTVSWVAPDDGAVTGYRVTLVGGGTSQTQTHVQATTTTTFTGLTAGTEYTVGVVTVSGDQQSSKVEHNYYTIPNVAQNLSLLSRTLHSLTVKWDAPDVGGLTGYTVSLEGDGTSLTQTPDSHTTVTFTGLAAGKEYTVGVVTVNGDQKSTQIEEKFYTELFAYKGTVTIVNQEYRETLADNTTKDYKDMSAKIEFEVRLAYSGSAVSGHIVAVTDIVFSKGSVKVDYKLELDTVSSTDTLKEELVEYVEDHSGMISELQINPSSITYDGKVTPTKVFPPWLLVALPTFGCLAVIVFSVLVCVLVRRRTKRSEDTTGRRNDRRWFGVGNMMWHQDNSLQRQPSRNRGDRHRMRSRV